MKVTLVVLPGIVTVGILYLTMHQRVQEPVLEPGSDAPAEALRDESTTLWDSCATENSLVRSESEPQQEQQRESAADPLGDFTEASGTRTAPEWACAFERKYLGFDGDQIEAARERVTRECIVALREHARTYLEAGAYLELGPSERPEPYLIPRSTTPGTNIYKFRFGHQTEEGATVTRWVFVQPSDISEAIQAMQRESTFLSMKAREMGTLAMGPESRSKVE